MVLAFLRKGKLYFGRAGFTPGQAICHARMYKGKGEELYAEMAGNV